jgi:TrmH family RNA methyltransferase
MISKSQIKLITSLSQKKFRDEHGLFVAEGTKLVLDLLSTFPCELLFANAAWINENKVKITQTAIELTDDELKKVSNQKSPQGVLAVFRKKQNDYNLVSIGNELSLALDNVQDPGNLGTIIRIADWFGIQNIFCSLHCADAFGPKTVQATMGALARVNIHYVELEELLLSAKKLMSIYGTFMDGKDIYHETFTSNGIIVMGNEGNGISPPIAKLINERLLIPNFPLGKESSESLNVGVATALICAEFRRRF